MKTIILSALLFLSAVTSAHAITYVNSCGQTLAKRGELYILTQNLSAVGDCLIVGADNITIDLKAFTISGDGTAAGIHEGSGRSATTIRSSVKIPGMIQKFQYGIDLAASNRSQISNVVVSGNITNGMILGIRALVKDCRATQNGNYGIEAGDYVQVQNCTISENSAGGLVVGNNALLIRNRVEKNLNLLFPDSPVNGIVAGVRSTLTGNVAEKNIGAGFIIGGQSQVNSNFATGNGTIGIQVACPSTVANNRSTGNILNYELYPDTCHVTNNK